MKHLTRYLVAIDYKIMGKVSNTTYEKTVTLLSRYATWYSIDIVIESKHRDATRHDDATRHRDATRHEDLKRHEKLEYLIEKSRILILLNKSFSKKTKHVESSLGFIPPDKKYQNQKQHEFYCKLNINGIQRGLAAACNTLDTTYQINAEQNTVYICHEPKIRQITFKRITDMPFVFQMTKDIDMQCLTCKYLVNLVRTTLAFKFIKSIDAVDYRFCPYVVRNTLFRGIPSSLNKLEDSNMLYQDCSCVHESKFHQGWVTIDYNYIETLEDIISMCSWWKFNKLTLFDLADNTDVDFIYYSCRSDNAIISNDVTINKDVIAENTYLTSDLSQVKRHIVTKKIKKSDEILSEITIYKNYAKYHTVRVFTIMTASEFSTVPFDKFISGMDISINEVILEDGLLVEIKRQRLASVSIVKFYYDPSTGYKLRNIHYHDKNTRKEYIIQYNNNGRVSYSAITEPNGNTDVYWRNGKPTKKIQQSEKCNCLVQ